MWIASGWPIHDIGEEALFTFHMIEHMLLALVALPALGQGMAPGPVRFTEVRNEEVRGVVELNGTVESTTAGVTINQANNVNFAANADVTMM